MTVDIVSWFHADTERFSSTYSQTLGDSTSSSHYAVYERCLRVLYASAARWNPSARLVLVTNAPAAALFSAHTIDLLDALGVRRHVVENTHETPPGYWGRWQNQFFVLDVARAVLEDPAVQPDDAVFVLDSDCIVTGPLRERVLGETGLAALVIGMDESTAENGLTRRDLTRLIDAFPGSTPVDGTSAAQYLGGELVAARAEVLQRVVDRAEEMFRWSLERRAAGLPAANEEAHLLSLAVQSLGLRWRDAGFINRMWTQPWKFRTVRRADARRIVWHLPAEKKTGIARLDRAVRRDGWFTTAPARRWRRRVGGIVGVPRYSAVKGLRDVVALVLPRLAAARTRTGSASKA